MPDIAPNPELLRSLGRLVRGLSALFWGLPATLIVCIGTASAGWFRAYGIAPPLAVTGLLLFGLWQLSAFQKQERPWRSALDRAGFFALVNLGLSPFLFWWNRAPDQIFFSLAVYALGLSAWCFLLQLNVVLQRLAAMLPDEALRTETRQYTALNRVLLLILLVLTSLNVALSQVSQIPLELISIIMWIARGSLGLIVFLSLLPLAMTMALLWKTKEVILDGVFGTKG